MISSRFIHVVKYFSISHFSKSKGLAVNLGCNIINWSGRNVQWCGRGKSVIGIIAF